MASILSVSSELISQEDEVSDDKLTLGISSSSNGTGEIDVNLPARHLTMHFQILMTIFYAFGIGGNLGALYIIAKKETKQFRKQTLMLNCLTINDLVALTGSCTQMYLKLYLPFSISRHKWMCALRVVWRAFGLGSGCVALVMAVERWLALTHPFTYQKHVTYTVIRRSIFGLWAFNLVLVCAPFAGFGLWYDAEKPINKCARYRDGKTPIDIAYAYLVFTFGMILCLGITCCNLSVIRALCGMGERLVTRRYSRASCRSNISFSDSSTNHATREELAFARLMAILCIFFVICWLPQLLTILFAQLTTNLPQQRRLLRVADVCIALSFALDPYLYVLFRNQRACNNRHIRKLCLLLCPRSGNVPARRTRFNTSLHSVSQPSSQSQGWVSPRLCCHARPLADCAGNTNPWVPCTPTGPSSSLFTPPGSEISDIDTKGTSSTNLQMQDKEYVPLELLLSSETSSGTQASFSNGPKWKFLSKRYDAV